MHENSRFHIQMKELLFGCRVASLATLDDDGYPHISMVPFAVNAADGTLLVHISALSPHFGFLSARPCAGWMVAAPEIPGAEVHALPRLSLQVEAEFLSRSHPNYEAVRNVYLHRFPDVAFMTELGDFAFVALKPRCGRVIAGFGAAKKVDQAAIYTAMGKLS